MAGDAASKINANAVDADVAHGADRETGEEVAIQGGGGKEVTPGPVEGAQFKREVRF